MTQEEYEQEQREIERLVNEINRLIAENNALVQEINSAISDIRVLRSNVATLHRNVEPVMTGVSGEVNVQSEKIHRIFEALEELTAQYATFKTLSTASKNLSQYTDEYHTRFSYYNNLRRITLGYVIGLDTNFVTNESMRKAVEKVYLQNTEYWLAYATTAVMLWASDEKEAAERAVGKAMFMNPSKAALFFMLINLRFDRIKPAQEWFVTYMDRPAPAIWEKNSSISCRPISAAPSDRTPDSSRWWRKTSRRCWSGRRLRRWTLPSGLSTGQRALPTPTCIRRRRRSPTSRVAAATIRCWSRPCRRRRNTRSFPDSTTGWPLQRRKTARIFCSGSRMCSIPWSTAMTMRSWGWS